MLGKLILREPFWFLVWQYVREEGDRSSSKVDKAINDEEKPNVQMRLKFFFLRNHLDAL